MAKTAAQFNYDLLRVSPRAWSLFSTDLHVLPSLNLTPRRYMGQVSWNIPAGHNLSPGSSFYRWELKAREVKSPIQGHTADEWHSLIQPGRTTLENPLLTGDTCGLRQANLEPILRGPCCFWSPAAPASFGSVQPGDQACLATSVKSCTQD